MEKIKRQLKKYYDKNVADRDSAKKHDWKLNLRYEILKTMKENKCRSLLELGAGTGQDSLFFMENGLSVTAVDLSEKHVERCKQKGIEAYVMDFSKMSFNDSTYDCVYAMNCLLHVPNEYIVTVLKEIKRVLKDEGIAFLCQYGGKCEEGVMDKYGMGDRFFSFRTRDVFDGFLVKAGFEVVKSNEIDLGEDGYNSQYFVIRPH